MLVINSDISLVICHELFHHFHLLLLGVAFTLEDFVQNCIPLGLRQSNFVITHNNLTRLHPLFALIELSGITNEGEELVHDCCLRDAIIVLLKKLNQDFEDFTLMLDFLRSRDIAGDEGP